jgi:O-antigen biosynthesis protein
VKVCFVLQDLALSGGVGVVVEHAHHLAEEQGFDVTLVVLDMEHGRWCFPRIDGVCVASLEEAVQTRFDVAVATWWRTAYRVFEIPAERYAYFVQSMEDRFYAESEVDRLQAAVTHDLPLAFITEARWIADVLAELRPDAPCHYVRNGVAKDVFAIEGDGVEPRTEGPLRILVEGHPGLWFKAVGEAVEATRLMREPREVTLVTSAQGPDRTRFSVDRTIGPLPAHQMAEAYREADVVLKLSRVEGMFGPPLEGFHMGATCVVSPVTGHDEYVVHGWNGIVTAWDDPRGTARWLDVLARDRRLLHHLRWNARKTAESWPSWSQSARFMASALRAIRNEPPPSGFRAARQMMGDVLVSSEHLRNERIMVDHVVRATEAEGHRHAEQWRRRHDELQRTRAYRIGVLLRERVWKHPLVRAVTVPLRLARRLGLKR